VGSVAVADIKRVGAPLLLGLVLDAALTLMCLRLGLGLETVSLAFLLGVVLQALTATFIASLAASLIAAAFLDYFFVVPESAMRVPDRFGFVALIAFVTVSLVVTRLAARARLEARNARRRSDIMELICACSQRLLSLEPEADAIRQVLKTYRELLFLRAVCYFDGEFATFFMEGVATVLPAKTRDAFIAGRDSDDTAHDLRFRCIRVRGRLAGAIGFSGLPEPALLLPSLVTLTTAALDRSAVFQAATRAEAETRAEVFRAAVLDALAHEFKTPLAIILTAAGGLQELSGTPSHRALTEEIENEALHLGELTSRLLTTSEFDNDRIQAERREVDLGQFIETLVARYVTQHGAYRIVFKHPLADSIFAPVDEELLRLAVGQLLDNALKYSEPESEVMVTLRHENGSAGIHVWNQGSVIAPGDENRIFQRFYRGAGSQRDIPGSGLGLYVARKIAQAHGGSLIVEETGQQGRGTSFCLMLPVLEKR